MTDSFQCLQKIQNIAQTCDIQASRLAVEDTTSQNPNGHELTTLEYLRRYFKDYLSQYQSAKNYTITPEETLELSIGLLKKAISFYRKFKYNVTAENRPLIEKFNVDNRLILGDLFIYQARLMKN